MIIFDLDGTIADCEHRKYFIDAEAAGDRIRKIIDKNGDYSYKKYTGEDWKPDWKSFYEACVQDEPINEFCDTFRVLCGQYAVEIWTGRCESVREKTEKWLNENLPGFSHIKLKMRPVGDHTPGYQLKEKWLDEYTSLIYPNINPNDPNGTEYIRKGPILMVFEGDTKVIKMWRRRGIFVFDCSQITEE